MKKYSRLAVFFLLLAFVFVISGCGPGVTDFIAKNYALVDVQGNAQDGQQKIYRAQNTTVAQVVDQLVKQQKPKEKSDIKNDQAVLVYDDNVVTIKKDDNKAQDSLISVSSYQFVRNNTDSGFWQGYLTARVLDVIFGSTGNRAPPGTVYRTPWDYHGSSSSGQTVKQSGGSNKPTTSTGTGEVIRKTPGSSSSSSYNNSSSYSKSNSSYSSKPRTSSGVGSVTRKSGHR